MIVKLLTDYHLEFLSLKGGYRGSFMSTHVKIPHCWKSHALAHYYYNSAYIILTHTYVIDNVTKISKDAKIRNRYNQVPHLTQDTIGKMTNSQLDTTNESQEISPFPAGDQKAQINRRT